MTSVYAEANIWVVIPARGGSIGIPRKNLKSIAGKPLVQHVIETAVKVVGRERTVLITDSVEIVEFAALLGVLTIYEKTPTPPHETLDEKVYRNLQGLRDFGATDEDFVLTVQPTSPLLSAETLVASIEKLLDGSLSVVSVAAERHLRWSRSEATGVLEPLYSERKNRQDIEPTYRETGAVIGSSIKLISKLRTRVVEPVTALVVPDSESIDIDDFGDLFQTSHLLTRSTVVIRIEANVEMGLGHAYRGLAIAHELSRHEVIFVVSQHSTMASELVSKSPYRLETFGTSDELIDLLCALKPEVLILDILDTDQQEISRIRSLGFAMSLITFEDEGSGASLCDVGIYDLTSPPKLAPSTSLVGPEYAVLGPSFELYGQLSSRIEKKSDLLVSFGGTDPARLTRKVVEALKGINYKKSVTIVSGPGSDFELEPELGLDVRHLRNVDNMALLIGEHAIGVGSRGRTVFEFAAMGVPVLCFSQNLKESAHKHVGDFTGSRGGGDGFMMSVDEITETLSDFLNDSEAQDQLRNSSTRFRQERSNRMTLLAALKNTSIVSTYF
jgi:CMP-N-acetylneuraminic acid synthetase